MTVFDPSKSMNALAQGMNVGSHIRDKQTQNALAPMVANNDFKGAMDYAGSRGDLGQVEAMQTQYQSQLTAEQEQRRGDTLKYGMSLLQVPFEQRNAEEVAMNLRQFGVDVDPSQLTDLSDFGINTAMTALQDTESLQKQYEEMRKQQEPYTLAPGARRFGPGGQEIAANPVAEKTPGYEQVTLADGEYEYIPGQPETMRKLGDSPVKTPLVSNSVTVGGPQTPSQYEGLPDGTRVDAPPGTKDLPAGQVYEVRGGQLTIQNLSGSEAERTAQNDERKRLGRSDSTRRAGGTVVREAARALALMSQITGWGDDNTQTEGGNTTGAQEILNANARAYMAANVRGSAEYQFMETIEGALSNVGLDVLQNMRDNSPTGGALGQVPIQQQQRLEQVLGSFKITMPKPMIVENLNYMTNAYLDIMYGSKRERDLLVSQGLLSASDNEEIQSAYKDLNYDQFGRYTPPPKAAIQELMSNPTPQEMAEFNQTFGPGAAEAIVNGER